MPQFPAVLHLASAVLPDDVSFIREVHDGAVVAPDMDPGVELFKLKKKFEVWKREFKEKLRTTGAWAAQEGAAA